IGAAENVLGKAMPSRASASRRGVSYFPAGSNTASARRVSITISTTSTGLAGFHATGAASAGVACGAPGESPQAVTTRPAIARRSRFGRIRGERNLFGLLPGLLERPARAAHPAQVGVDEIVQRSEERRVGKE